jgi:putative ABC transport system permease protein
VATFILNQITRRKLKHNGSEREVWFLSIIGLFILVIAWINYINLSTARSMERAKEVGLRKVVGAARSQLITQFLFESLLLNILALILAVRDRSRINAFFPRLSRERHQRGFFTTGLGSEPSFWVTFIILFISGALLVGLYPSFIVSSFRPATVLKGMNRKICLWEFP